MAQAMLSTLARNHHADTQIASAGLLPGGLPLPVETRDALIRLGFNGSGLERFRSHQLTPGLVSGADLVLGLAREHVREVIVRSPEAWDRTFTLKELVRRGASVPLRLPDEELAQWLGRAGAGRDRRELLGASNEDDVADPMGGVPAGFEHTAKEIHALCVALTGLLWP
jgi:protein-tyrosine phosphatase